MLEKAIPAQAGLAGGSSDAAATLVALGPALGSPTPPERLDALAGEIGSDVAFFIACSGRGLPRAGRAGGVGPSQGKLSLCVGLSAGRHEHGRRLSPGGSTRTATADRADSGGPGTRWTD